MTINQLHKLTQKLVDQGYGRRKVTIDKSTFASPLEDEGGVIIDVVSADVEVIRLMDGDGFTETTKSGREKVMVTMVMVGDNSRMNASEHATRPAAQDSESKSN